MAQEGWDEFKGAIRELSQSARIDRERLDETQKQTAIIAENLKGFKEGVSEIKTSIEKVTREAIEAQITADHVRQAQEKADTKTQQIQELVIRHDQRIADLQKREQPKWYQSKWVIAAGFLVLLFGMFSYNPEAAREAWRAVTGIVAQQDS